MQQVVEIKKSGVSLVVAVELPERFELPEEQRRRQGVELSPKHRIGHGAGVVTSIPGRTQSLSQRGASANGRGRVPPLGLAAPLFELWFPPFAGGGGLMVQKHRQGSAGQALPARLVHEIGDPQKIVDHFLGVRLLHAAVPVPGGKLSRGLREPFKDRRIDLGRGGLRGPVLLQELSRLSDEPERFVRRSQHQGGQEIPLLAGVPDGRNAPQAFGAPVPSQPSREPGVQKVLVCEFRRRRIDDGGARVQAGLHRIGPDQLLAKAVNGGAGDFVQRLAAPVQMVPLGLGQARRQCCGQLDGNRAGQELPHQCLDPLQQFGGGRLREGDGDEVLGINPRADQQSHSSGHERRLAAAGARLHQERTLVIRQSRNAGRRIGKAGGWLVNCHVESPGWHLFERRNRSRLGPKAERCRREPGRPAVA